MAKTKGPDNSMPTKKEAAVKAPASKKKKFSTKPQPFLTATTKSWQKNSFGLFDYECQEFQKSQFRLEQTGKVIRYEKPRPEDKKNLIVNIQAQHEDLNTKEMKYKPGVESQVARLLCQDGGFWIYHKNKVDLSTLFSQPEEKLWLVVQNYQGGLGSNQNPAVPNTAINEDDSISSGLKRGFKLEKNSVIKFGRVRVRVRDIDYPYSQNQFKPIQNAEPEFKVEDKKYDSATGTRRDAYATGPNFLDVNIDEAVSPAGIKTDFTNLNQLIIEDNARNVSPQNKKMLANKSSQKIEVEQNSVRGRTKLTEESEPVCRICWGTEGEDIQNALKDGADPDEYNPLISPCKCTGTMGLIHVKCLRGWLETKRTRKENKKQVIFKFKKLDCELCKQNFPFKITYGNRIVDIVGVEKPEKNYIILESLSSETQKIFYMINTEDIETVSQLTPAGSELKRTQAIKIGRGQDSDVRVTDDISVSRNHAYIQKTQNGDYYLVDNNSKFGTLVLVQYPIFLSPKLLSNNPLVLQSGKTCLSLNVRQTQTCADNKLACCFRSFLRKSKGQKPKLATLDGVSYFPEEFIDKSASEGGIKMCNDSQEDEEAYPPEPSARSVRGRSGSPRAENQPAQSNAENREAALLTTNRNNRNQAILGDLSQSGSRLQVGQGIRLPGDDSVRDQTLLQPRNNANFHMVRLNRSNQFNDDASPRSPGRLLQQISLQVDQSFPVRDQAATDRRRQTQNYQNDNDEGNDLVDRDQLFKRAISAGRGPDSQRAYDDFSLSMNDLHSVQQEQNIISDNYLANHQLQEYLGLDLDLYDPNSMSRSFNNRFQHNLFNALPRAEPRIVEDLAPPDSQGRRDRKQRRSHLIKPQDSDRQNQRAQAPLPVIPNIGFTQRSVPHSDFSVSPNHDNVKATTTPNKAEKAANEQVKMPVDKDRKSLVTLTNNNMPSRSVQQNLLDMNSATFDLVVNYKNQSQSKVSVKHSEDQMPKDKEPPMIAALPEELKDNSLLKPLETHKVANPQLIEEVKEPQLFNSCAELQVDVLQRSMSFGRAGEASLQAQGAYNQPHVDQVDEENSEEAYEPDEYAQIEKYRDRPLSLSSQELRDNMIMYEGYRSHSMLQRESQQQNRSGSESVSGSDKVEDL